MIDGAPDEGAPMNAVMDRLTAEQREKALRIAYRYGISEGDVTWVLVLLALDAQDSKVWAGQAAQAAGEAADRIRDEIRALPDKLKEGAAAGAQEAKIAMAQAGKEIGMVWVRAGSEIQARVAQSIQSEAENFNKKLVAAGEIKKKEIVQDWQAALTGAVKNHGRSELTKSVIFTVIALILMIGASDYLSFQYGMSAEQAAEKVCHGNGWELHTHRRTGDIYCLKRMGVPK